MKVSSLIKNCQPSFRRMAVSLLVGMSLVPFVANAKPAIRDLVKMTQPDGTELSVRILGDEFAHTYLSEDGYVLRENSDGILYYAVEANGKIQISDVRANNVGMRSASEQQFLAKIVDKDKMIEIASIADQAQRVRKQQVSVNLQPQRIAPENKECPVNLLMNNAFYAHGNAHALVVLVEYKDVPFTTPNIYDYFNRALNEPGFNDNGATGSAFDFFNENSNGRFTPVFDVYGPIKLSKNRSYYGSNNFYGSDSNPEMMCIEACQQLDDQIDFSIYDTDGDGYIDNVFIFYAGKGEADGGGAITVWPHSWYVEDGANKYYEFDGKRLNRYGCANEIDNKYARVDGIGTFVHEFSHVMGLPDLYATTYNNSFTPGYWSCMDYGPYNNEGRTPPNYGAFERVAMGWLEPREFTRSVKDFELRNMTEDVVYMVPTKSIKEFFLIEKRERTGWDAFIPNSGMLVWYIDYDLSDWTSNSVNNNPTRQRVDIIEADNRKTDGSREGDCFPGTFKIREFSYDTMPAFKSRENQKCGVQFFNIRYDYEEEHEFGTAPLYIDVKLDDAEYGEITHDPLYLWSNVNPSYSEPSEFDQDDYIHTIEVEGLKSFSISTTPANAADSEADQLATWSEGAISAISSLDNDKYVGYKSGYSVMETPFEDTYTITVNSHENTIHIYSRGTGISDVISPDVFKVNGNVINAHAALEVYSIDGRRIATLAGGESTMLPAAGIYIVRSEGKTAKIIR